MKIMDCFHNCNVREFEEYGYNSQNRLNYLDNTMSENPGHHCIGVLRFALTPMNAQWNLVERSYDDMIIAATTDVVWCNSISCISDVCRSHALKMSNIVTLEDLE